MVLEHRRRAQTVRNTGVQANHEKDLQAAKTNLWNHAQTAVTGVATAGLRLGDTPDSRRSGAISFEASIAPAGTTRERGAAAIVTGLNRGEMGCMCRKLHSWLWAFCPERSHKVPVLVVGTLRCGAVGRRASCASCAGSKVSHSGGV